MQPEHAKPDGCNTSLVHNEQLLFTAADQTEVAHTPLLASAAEVQEWSSRLGCSW